MGDFLFEALSGTRFDGDPTLSNASFWSGSEPQAARFLAFIKAVAIYEFNGKGWAEAVAGTALAGRSPVETTINREPEPSYLRSTQLIYPLLAFYRREATREERTLERVQLTCRWGLLYILGPLKPEDFERVAAARDTFPALVALLLRQRCHAAYDSGADQVDDDKACDFGSIELGRFAIGRTEFGDDGAGLSFYVADCEIVTTELERYLDDTVPPFEGADYSLDISGPGGTLPDLIQGTDG